MTPEQALQILAHMASLSQVSLKAHQSAQQAAQVLNALISEATVKSEGAKKDGKK